MGGGGIVPSAGLEGRGKPRASRRLQPANDFCRAAPGGRTRSGLPVRGKSRVWPIFIDFSIVRAWILRAFFRPNIADRGLARLSRRRRRLRRAGSGDRGSSPACGARGGDRRHTRARARINPGATVGARGRGSGQAAVRCVPRPSGGGAARRLMHRASAPSGLFSCAVGRSSAYGGTALSRARVVCASLRPATRGGSSASAPNRIWVCLVATGAR